MNSAREESEIIQGLLSYSRACQSYFEGDEQPTKGFKQRNNTV